MEQAGGLDALTAKVLERLDEQDDGKRGHRVRVRGAADQHVDRLGHITAEQAQHAVCTVDCVLRDRAALVRLEERLLHGELGLAERTLVHLPWEQTRDAARVCAERHGVEEQLCKACLALDLGALERVERRELPEPALAPELDLVLQARMQREPVLVERRMQVGADLVDGVVQNLPELYLGDQPCVRAVLGERAVVEPLDRVAHHGVLPRHGRAPVRDARLVVRDVD